MGFLGKEEQIKENDEGDDEKGNEDIEIIEKGRHEVGESI